MVNYKVGDVVAIHYSKSAFKEISNFLEDFFDYPEHGSYKKVRVLKIKRHWFYCFKTMYLLSDGMWYSKESITPVVKYYFKLEKSYEN